MNIKRLFSLPVDLPADLRSNIINYYFDISWWGLYAGATAAFLTIYAARIGATPAQIGLLSALPAAITGLISLPFASVVRRMGAHRATWIGAFVSRLLFLVYALLPFFLNDPGQVQGILVLAVVMTVPNTLIGIGFPQLMMEALTPDWRGVVVGVRNAFFSIITFVVTLISGQLLTRLPFPINYQLVFVIGFVGGIMTAYQLYHVRPLPELCQAEASPVNTRYSLKAGLNLSLRERFLPTLNDQGRRYLRVLALLFLFNMTNNMVTPLVPGLLVNTLRLSDAWISIGTAANSAIYFIISMLIAPITRRTGNRGGTAVGAGLLALQSVVLALAREPGLYMVSVVLGGLGAGILASAQFNYHLDNVPDTERASWLSWNLMVGNAALLFGALLGPLIASRTGDPLALAIFGALRLLMGLLIFKLG